MVIMGALAACTAVLGVCMWRAARDTALLRQKSLAQRARRGARRLEIMEARLSGRPVPAAMSNRTARELMRQYEATGRKAPVDSFFSRAAAQSDFEQHYRVPPRIVSMIARDIGHLICLNRSSYPAEFQIMVYFFRLGHLGGEYSTVSTHFGISFASVARVSNRVCDAINQCLVPRLIRFPRTLDEMREKAAEFERLSPLPGTVAAVDGCLIPVLLKPGDISVRDALMSHKYTVSINLMAVCDAQMRVLAMHCGFGGRTHDARVLRDSGLHAQLDRLISPFPAYHILGDPAFPLSTFLLRRYPGDDAQRAIDRADDDYSQPRLFNVVQSAQRIRVEHLFAALKGRFRALRIGVNVNNFRNMASHVCAAVAVHNFCIDHFRPGDTPGKDLPADTAEEPPKLLRLAEKYPVMISNKSTPSRTQTSPGAVKREALAQRLFEGDLRDAARRYIRLRRRKMEARASRRHVSARERALRGTRR